MGKSVFVNAVITFIADSFIPGIIVGNVEIQATSALVAMKMLGAGIPAICTFVSLFFSFFFNIEKECK